MRSIPVAERSTAGLLQMAHNRLSRSIFDFVVAAGFPDIRRPHASAMEQLTHEDGLRLSQLAARAGMTPQSMGELVDDLERLGFVEKRADPADRRARRIFLARKGRAAVAASAHAVANLERRLQAQLGRADYVRLRAMLLEIIRAYSPEAKQ
jgi:DNA-binding MarR family transcriptional regulator